MADLFTGNPIKMFARTLFQIESSLIHLFVIILLCLGYFNYCLITEPIAFFLQISSLTGQILVNKFLTICNCSFEIVKLTYSFFQILYEDSLIFFKDATEKFSYAVHLLKELYLLLEPLGWNFLKTVLLVVENIIEFFGFLHQTTGTVKQGIHFFGSNVWYFFTNIPKTILSNVFGIHEFWINTFYELLKYIYKIKSRISEGLEKTYLFLFDVPLHSVYGLIIGAVLLTIIFIKFKNICYFISSVFLKLCNLLASFGVSLRNGEFLGKRTKRYVDYSSEDDERLCIICQYHLKEVIIFPCKHLCICADCSEQLSENQPLCPICRSGITETLKVYI